MKNGELVEVHSAPKPVGRKDSFVSKAKLNEGSTYMGESQTDYNARIEVILQQKVVNELDNNLSEEVLVENSVAVNEPVEVKKPVKKSSQNDKVAMAADTLNINDIESQSESDKDSSISKK